MSISNEYTDTIYLTHFYFKGPVNATYIMAFWDRTPCMNKLFQFSYCRRINGSKNLVKTHFHDNTSSKRNSPNCDPPAKLSNNNNMTHVYTIYILPILCLKGRLKWLRNKIGWWVLVIKGGRASTLLCINIAHPQIL